MLVVGGSAAGLASALQLGRQGRSVIVADVDPMDPTTSAAREDARRHGVEVIPARVELVTEADPGCFRVSLVGGHAIVAGRVLQADDLHRDDIDVSTAGPSASAADWDHRYSGDRMWSGNPNGTLVRELTGRPPARSLDVGAGEGGDAIWLAEQGWTVTANDISQRALDRLAAEAHRRGLHLETRRGDANAPRAFGTATFDLVSAFYASIPRTPDHRAVHNLLDAVAPGGTLLVVSHDLEPMRTPIDTTTQSRPFDPDAYVRVDDVAAALAEAPDWEIEVYETRPRPPGSATAAHHVDDVVLRAHRREP